MQTKPKRNSIVTSRWDNETRTLVFGVLNQPNPPLRLNFTAIHAAVINRFAIHGAVQRVVDAAAIDKDTDPGTPAERLARMCERKYAKMARLVDHYNSGTEAWSPDRMEVPRGPDVGLIIKAMLRAGLAADVDAANRKFDGTARKRNIDRDAAVVLWASTAEVITALRDMAAEIAPSADDLLSDDMDVSGDEDGDDIPETDE